MKVPGARCLIEIDHGKDGKDLWQTSKHCVLTISAPLYMLSMELAPLLAWHC